tara:strand:- start:37 stop:633 length:597 start_codon:yes stop_codon:yes gene_type:complete
MPQTDTDLAALIGSRICHDLISPIGAINNGLELLSMSGDAGGPEIGLIGESVGSASARIRFFRIAFGAAADQMVGAAEVLSILRDLYDGSRLTVRWPGDTPHARADVRLVFLSILCLESALPYGGVIEVAHNGPHWTVTGRADRIAEMDGLWPLLSRDQTPHDLQPAHVQFALLPIICGEAGRELRTSHGETSLSVMF